MTRAYHLIRYLFIFSIKLVKANFEVVKLVLSPKLRIRPGFLAVPMKAKTDFEITSLANSITLTPGTISVHVDPEAETIVIHALNIGEDPDQVRNTVRNSLEANILKWTRPRGGRQGDDQ